MRPEIVFDEERHKYTVNGEIYPSVTTIIGSTVPKDLSWWGMMVGCDGVFQLMQDPDYVHALDNLESGDDLVQLLKLAKLTTNHQMKRAGKTGTAIHKALENYGRHGHIPMPLAFEPEERPRIAALAGWILENRPVFLDSEVRTASVEHGYAGTFDARVFCEAGEQKGKRGLIDLKNTKRVYPDQHFPQLEAYEEAEREAGEEATDFRAVLHLPPVGDAALVVSTDTFRDFEVLLDHYNSLQARKGRLKRAA